MLYRLDVEGNRLEPEGYASLEALSKREKDLENLLADNLLGTLFEQPPLFPFFQERSYQPEADIYALAADGDIVIFELKTAVADSGALDQLLRYAQVAGSWTYADIERKYFAWLAKSSTAGSGHPMSLRSDHQVALGLDEPLAESQFNTGQHMWVVGNAADEGLIRAVDYWKKRGLSIDFIPYRLYDIGGSSYFEFFSKPYDSHVNPRDRKGVLFDTNRTYDEDALRHMIVRKRISTFGGNDAVGYLSKGDVVFYSHRGMGIVCAAKVLTTNPRSDDSEGAQELYHEVEFLTPTPASIDDAMKAVSFRRVQEVTGKSFWWAATAKTPYLTLDEAARLQKELSDVLLG